MMTSIPKRVFKIWESRLNVKTCGSILKTQKLECSECNEQFDSLNCFAVHIEVCNREARKNPDVNYQLHMHANRILISQSHLSELCGTDDHKQYLECGLCKMKFDEEKEVKEHIRRCSRYQIEFGNFMRQTREVYKNMLDSHEQLGILFKKFDKDEHIIKIRETKGETKVEEEEETPSFYIKTDSVSDYFFEKYQDFLLQIKNFAQELFIRFLKKREIDSSVQHVFYSVPAKRRSVDSAGDDNEESDSGDEDVSDSEDGNEHSDVEMEESEGDVEDSDEEAEDSDEEAEDSDVQMEDSGDDVEESDDEEVENSEDETVEDSDVEMEDSDDDIEVLN